MPAAKKYGFAVEPGKIGKLVLRAADLMTGDPSGWPEARLLLEDARAMGSREAPYAIACFYLHGQGIRKNYRKAVVYLTEAATLGHPSALYDLAICHEKGEGTPKNKRAAFDCYMRAALAGGEKAVAEVARCWSYGIGIAANQRLADIWADHADALEQRKKRAG